MNELIWDFGSLSQDQESDYVKALLEIFCTENHIFKQFDKQDPKLAFLSKVITESQELVRKITGNVASVSQRDFQRVFKLITFFFEKTKTIIKLVKEKALEKPPGFRKDLSDPQILEKRFYFFFPKFFPNLFFIFSTLLAIAVCYYFRLQTVQEDPKNSQLTIEPRKIFETFMDKKFEEGSFKELLDDEMTFYLKEMKNFPGSIAKNEALKENIFSLVVSISTRFFFFFFFFFFFIFRFFF